MVRHRHPDLDLVVLPPLVGDLPPATPDRAQGLLARGRAALARLHERVGREPSAHVELWWQQDRPDVHRLVARESFRDLDPDDAVQLLRDLGDALLAEGCSAGPAAGPVPALEATTPDGDLVVSVRAAEGAVDLELVSAPVRLDADDLPGLVASR